MANTLTNLYTYLYESLDVVSREMVGFIPAVFRDATAQRAAVNQQIITEITPAAAAEDLTPGLYAPDTGDQTIGNAVVTITKSRAVPFRITGEETKALNSGAGAGYNNIKDGQVAQALRTLINEIETDLGGLYYKASRAYGTAGATPFGTAGDLSDIAQTRKILEDNGAPTGSLQMVLGSAATANIRGKQSTLFKVNEAGTDNLLRNGDIGELEGFAFHNSAGVRSGLTIGGGASYQLNGAHAVGATTINVDTGTGTIIQGDVVTIAGNKYLVATALSAGSFTINAPGLQVASLDNVAVAVGASYTANMAFSRNAIVLAARLPALPDGGDMADDIVTITDPRTGMTFEFAVYRQFRRVRYHVAAAWGVAGIKPEHTAVLLG